MNYLVTGATGFLGTNIVQQLLNDNCNVVGFSFHEPSAHQVACFKQKSGQIEYVQGDVRNRRLLEEVFSRYSIDTVIHAAVITSNAAREKQQAPEIVDINVTGSANVAQHAFEAGVKRFLLVGSLAVYAAQNRRDGEVVTEETPHSTETLYEVSKSATEKIVARISSLHDRPLVIGRVGTAYGPWEHSTGVRDTLSPMFQLTKIAMEGGHAILPFDKYSNWQYGRDAAHAIVKLANAGSTRHQDYNLGPNQAWPLSAWCERLATRFPNFRFSFGTPGNIDLYGGKNGALLSGQRYMDEFGDIVCFDLDAAFDDYTNWLVAGS